MDAYQGELWDVALTVEQIHQHCREVIIPAVDDLTQGRDCFTIGITGRTRMGKRHISGSYPLKDGWMRFDEEQILWRTSWLTNVAEAEQFLVYHYQPLNGDQDQPVCLNQSTNWSAGNCNSKDEAEFILYCRMKMMEDIEEGKGYKLNCSVCDYGTESQKELDMHFKQEHADKEKPYKCRECNKRFVQKSGLGKHIGKVHGKIPQIEATKERNVQVDRQNLRIRVREMEMGAMEYETRLADMQRQIEEKDVQSAAKYPKAAFRLSALSKIGLSALNGM